MRTPFVVIGLGLGVIVGVNGQSRGPAQSASPTFDVISVKPLDPNADGTITSGSSVQPGRFRATGTSLMNLIVMAYRSPGRPLRANQIVGAPPWASSSRFDITATADLTREVLETQLPALLRSMLADRFKLSAHVETRTVPIYALVKARNDGRLGPQLRPALVDCETLARERRANPAAPPSPPCGSISLGAGKLTGRVITLAVFAASLSVDRPVVDRTGLSGNFDMDLEWLAERPQGNPAGVASPGVSDGPSIFAALQEQLGLKLESGQEPRDVVVIEHVERPAPD